MEEIDDDELIDLIHKRYDDPRAEWKDLDDKLAILDIGRLLGLVVRLRREIKNEATQAAFLKEHIRWMAQTVHQAYHGGHGAWNQTCLQDICSSTRRQLREYR